MVKPPVAKRDYYDILGVGRDADEQQLKSAYRKLALQHHPDRNPDNPDSEVRFKEAAEAYSVLTDGQNARPMIASAMPVCKAPPRRISIPVRSRISAIFWAISSD